MYLLKKCASYKKHMFFEELKVTFSFLTDEECELLLKLEILSLLSKFESVDSH